MEARRKEKPPLLSRVRVRKKNTQCRRHNTAASLTSVTSLQLHQHDSETELWSQERTASVPALHHSGTEVHFEVGRQRSAASSLLLGQRGGCDGPLSSRKM